MNQKLMSETLKELTQLQRSLDYMVEMAEDEDCDAADFQEVFMAKFCNLNDYSNTCSKAKGCISAAKEMLK